MKRKSSKPGVSGLLTSAKEFLIESIKNYEDGKTNFAIVHAVTATELVLKRRLEQVNPALILWNIDSKSPQTERTVSLEALPRRLANFGMPVTVRQAELIKTIAQWRNQIVHHMPAFDKNLAKRHLLQLLDFLAEYLRTEIKEPIESFLPKNLYKIVYHLLDDWKKVVLNAQAKAIQEGSVLTDACPSCKGTSVMSRRNDNAIYCHLCKADLYMEECRECKRSYVSLYEYSEEEGPGYCDECIQDAGDYYIQLQTDIKLGK